MTSTYNSMAAYASITTLSFTLLNQDEQPTLYITPDDSGQTMRLEVQNTSQLQYTLPNHPDGVVSNQLYVFELRFRPGTLDTQTDNSVFVTDTNWKVTFYHNESDGCDSLFFINVNEITFAPGSNISLELHNIFVSALGGARNTRVAFNYQGIQASTDTISGTCTQNLQVLHGQSQPLSPFDICILGNDRVLNDNVSTSQISVGISRAANTNVLLSSDDTYGKSTITLQIIVNKNDSGLTSSNYAQNISYSRNDSQWSKQTPLNETQYMQWSFEFVGANNTALTNTLQFTLSNIKTNYLPGPTQLSVFYDNIPGYADGVQVLQIHKAPLLFQSNCVGICTTDYQEALNVKGNISIQNGGNIHFTTNAIIQSTSEQNAILFTSDKLELRNRGPIKFTPGYNNANSPASLYLTNDGKVGIATENPGAKLTINNGQLQVCGSETPTSGAGVEIGFDGTNGTIRSYNHDINQYKYLQISSGGLFVNTNDQRKLSIDASGFAVSSGQVVTGIPIVDFQQQTISDTVIDDSFTIDDITFSFSSKVLKAEAFVSGWFLEFIPGQNDHESDDDDDAHELTAAAAYVKDCDIVNNSQVQASVKLIWNHDSHKHGVKYSANVIVIALLEKSFAVSGE